MAASLLVSSIHYPHVGENDNDKQILEITLVGLMER